MNIKQAWSVLRYGLPALPVVEVTHKLDRLSEFKLESVTTIRYAGVVHYQVSGEDDCWSDNGELKVIQPVEVSIR